jgi:PST family polysaccharide transporter
LKLLVGAAILAAGMVVSLWLPGDLRGAFRLLLLGVAALSGTSFLNGLLRGIDRLDVEAKIGLVQKILFAGGSAAGVWAREYGPDWVGFCYLGSHIVAFGLTAAWLARRSLLLVRPSGGGSLRACFYQAGPLVVAALLIFLALRLDVFLLQWLAGSAAVGVYAAAFRYVEGWVMVTTAYLLALFPRLVAENNKKPLLSGSAKRSAHLLAGGGILAALITWWLAPYVTSGLLGASFVISNRVLRGLVVVLPVLFLSMLWGQALIAHGRQHVYALVLLLGTLVSVAVDCWTIPRWGAWGAVVGVWVRESFQFAVLAGYLVKKG